MGTDESKIRKEKRRQDGKRREKPLADIRDGGMQGLVRSDEAQLEKKELEERT